MNKRRTSLSSLNKQRTEPVVFSFALHSSDWPHALKAADAHCEPSSLFVLHLNARWSGNATFEPSTKMQERRVLVNPQRLLVERFKSSVLMSHLSNFRHADANVHFSHFALMAENGLLTRSLAEHYIRHWDYSFAIGFRSALPQCMGDVRAHDFGNACLQSQMGPSARPPDPDAPRCSHEGSFATRSLWRDFAREYVPLQGEAATSGTLACFCEESWLYAFLRSRNLTHLAPPFIVRVQVTSQRLCDLMSEANKTDPRLSGVYGFKGITLRAQSLAAQLEWCKGCAAERGGMSGGCDRLRLEWTAGSDAAHMLTTSHSESRHHHVTTG